MGTLLIFWIQISPKYSATNWAVFLRHLKLSSRTGNFRIKHHDVAAVVEKCIEEIRQIQAKARSSGEARAARWPMIILRTPKGWTGPKEVAGHKLVGSWRAHQIPIVDVREEPAHLKLLEQGTLRVRLLDCQLRVKADA